MKRFFAISLAVALLATGALLFCTPSASAQAASTVAQLNGTVRDTTGRVVVNAAVTLRNLYTNRQYTTSTNNSGWFLIPNLPPGPYELKVTYTGFAPYIQPGIQLLVGQVATQDVMLSVQGKGEVVEVTGEAQAIEPTRTEISHVVETKQIESLPISGRLFTDFALLTPGVATGRTSLQSTITEFEVTRVSFAGMRDLSNEVTVDGADNINTATGSQRATPPQEAVQEFRVVNNSFGAEYGRALGGIVNIVTKSGTNQLHGSLYEYFQNNSLDARSLLQPAPQPNVLRQNQFGASLGGPIRKDKTFFFMNYEGQRRGESPTYPGVLLNNLTVINAAKLALGIPAENLNVLKTKDNDYGIVKLDHQLTAHNQLSLRYNVEDGRDLNQLVGATLDGGGIGAPSSGHDVFIRDQSLAGIVTTQISNRVVNTALGQFARRHYNFPGVTGQPGLDIPNELMIGHNFGVLDRIYENRVQGSDSLSLVRGTHFIRLGTDVNYVQNHVIWPGFTPMRIVLPGVTCLLDFANFVNPAANLQGAPDGPCPLDLNPATVPAHGTPIVFWGAPMGPAPIPPNVAPGLVETLPTGTWPFAYLPSQAANFSFQLNHSYYGFFAQDQWKITPKLTFNYGLRYDFETGLSKQIDPHYNGIQPRIGLAYSPDHKTVIRAGFGIFDDRYNLSFLFITGPQRPAVLPGAGIPGVREGAETAVWALNQLPYIFVPALGGDPFTTPAAWAASFLRTGNIYANKTLGDGIPVPLGGGLLLGTTVGDGLVDPRSPIPYSEQANLEVDREVGGGVTIGVGYIFVTAHHLVRATHLNVCPVSGVASGPYPCAPAGPPPPGWPAGKEFFSGTPRYPAGLLYYTDNTGNSVYHGGTFQVTKRAGKYVNLNANYTYSHTLDDGTFTTFVSTPQDVFRRNIERATSNQDVRHRFVTNFSLAGPAHSFARGFLLSNIITLQSARPFTIFTGFDANNDTNPVTDRVGNAARNTYQGDSFQTWDIRLSRTMNLAKVHEGATVELAADAFNFLNRPNVDEVVSVYGTYNFCGGHVPVQYNDQVTRSIQAEQTFGTCPAAGPPLANPLFGKPRTMFNPRQLQLSVKFSF